MSSYKFEFKPTAVKDLQKLPAGVCKRIGLKLDYHRQQTDPLVYATKLTNLGKGGDYRFRIGQYRVVFDVSERTIIILYIEHRREVYRK